MTIIIIIIMIKFSMIIISRPGKMSIEAVRGLLIVFITSIDQNIIIIVTIMIIIFRPGKMSIEASRGKPRRWHQPTSSEQV